MSFSKHGLYFEEYLKPRYSSTGMKDLLTLKLLPYLDGLYRDDLLLLIGKKPHEEPSVDGVFLSHIHQDHSAFIALLDERIPVSCSYITQAYAKAILESRPRSLETEVYNFKKRPLVDRKVSPIQRTFKQLESEKTTKTGSIEIKPFSVDHSVPGAMAFLIHTSEKTLVYTGDLRLRGVCGHLTKKFLDALAKEDVDLMLCEGTNIHENENQTEEYVEKNADNVVSRCKQLVVADFAYKDLHRFLTFYKVASGNNRKIVISRRHAYLLNELRNIPEIGKMIPGIDDENILIYVERKDTGRYVQSDYDGWERDFVEMSNAVKADWIHGNQEKVIVCFTFFDINELIDVAPSSGSVYIHSSSEPHNEEQIIDVRRLNNWIDFFGLEKHHFHASGHASGPEIREIVQATNAKELIPIHTEHPEHFRKMHKNVSMPKLETF